MPDQCYFNGNYYQAAAATTAGQSPATTPASWSLVQIPARFRWLLAHLTYANLLEIDGQKDKAVAERQATMQDDRRGLDVVIRAEANGETFLERPSVRLPNFI